MAVVAVIPTCDAFWMRATAQALIGQQHRDRCRIDDDHAKQRHARTCRLSDDEPTAPDSRHGSDNATDGTAAARKSERTSARALQGRATKRQRHIQQKQWPDSRPHRQGSQHYYRAPHGKGWETI